MLNILIHYVFGLLCVSVLLCVWTLFYNASSHSCFRIKNNNNTIVVSPLNVYYTRDYCFAIILITLVSWHGFDINYLNETHDVALRV